MTLWLTNYNRHFLSSAEGNASWQGCTLHWLLSALLHQQLPVINHSFLLLSFKKRTDLFIGYFLPSEIPEDFPLARVTGALNMLWTDAQAPGPESLYCPRGSDAHRAGRSPLWSWLWPFSRGWGCGTGGWLLLIRSMQGAFRAPGDVGATGH